MSAAVHSNSSCSTFIAFRACYADTPVCCAIRDKDFLGSVSNFALLLHRYRLSSARFLTVWHRTWCLTTPSLFVKCFIVGRGVGRILNSIQRLATGSTVRGSNPSEVRLPFLQTRPNRPWDPTSFLYNWHQDSLTDGKLPGRGTDLPPPSTGRPLPFIFVRCASENFRLSLRWQLC